MSRKKLSANVLQKLLVLLTLLAMMLPYGASYQAAASPLESGSKIDGVRLEEALPQWELPSAADVRPAAQAVPTETDTIYLKVVSARTEPMALDGQGVLQGDPVTEYQYIINVDNTGDPFQDAGTGCNPYLDPPTNTVRNPDYPDACDWPSIRTVPGWSPIYTQGDESVLNETTGITLPPGNYLISVVADGYKIDGEHFTIPMAEPGLIEVPLHPLPLPPATIEIIVFEDNALTNGQYDGPAEHGLAGFRASINDIAGEITADLFGNPLCTVYEKDEDGDILLDGDGAPIIQTLGRGCYSNEDGIISIPNVGPLRYDVLVIPPDGEEWIQTTTLEGSQGWDTWLQEAGTGLDNEFVIAAEPFPWTMFGFVKPSTSSLPSIPDGGTIRGNIMAALVYTPFTGGLPYQGDVWGGLSGAKIDRPISDAWLALMDLQNGDIAIWVGMANEDGSFEINNVPVGNYVLTYWDEKQHFILDFVQLSVYENEVTDLGNRFLTGWFAEFYGTVFHDYNENGKRDPGEPGVPDYLVVLKDRDNTEIDRMSIASLTDHNGFYEFEKGYPMSSWMVLEAYSDIYYTTGITFQASNQITETTVLGPIVDVGVLPILGQKGRLDWGVNFYDENSNGGIAGTVFYDTVRAEDNARFAGAEPWQPGIPDLQLNLYAAITDAEGNPVLDPADGSYQKGPLLATTTTETYNRPENCTPRDVDGVPFDYPTALAPYTGGFDCLEGPMMGLQFGQGQNELDGNWGFGEIYYDPVTGDPLDEPIPLPPGNYLVEVEIPNDPITGKPVFQVTREEDLNVFEGDTFVPAIPPPACAGPLHEVDIAGIAPDGTLTTAFDGPDAVENTGYVEAGGSRYEGEMMPLCNVKFVQLSNGKAVAPIFNLFTEVPIPGKWKGYIIDDLNLSTNPFELFFGEKAGLAYMPIGIYDYTGRLVHTVHSDFNGVYEVLLPSTNTFNTPTPSGMTANVYYIYGNDPGSLANPNPYYNPQYRSIGTSFEIYPGTIVPSDLAPIRNGVGFQAPGSNVSQAARCEVPSTFPQLYRVSQPYVDSTTRTVTITGTGFGDQRGRIRMGFFWLPISSWTDREIVVKVPIYVVPGPYQLNIIKSNGDRVTNSITMHVLGLGYNPTVYEVGPGKQFNPLNPIYDGTAAGPIQDAINTAWEDGGNALIVIYPNQPVELVNPLGAYYENPVIYSPVKLQGVGPGGDYPDAPGILGTILDGRGIGGDTPYTSWWRAELIPEIWNNRGGWDGSLVDNDGNPRLFEGAVITVFANQDEFTANYRAAIDGVVVTGGDQQGFPNNLWEIGGGRIPGVPAEVVVQGGGIYINAYAQYLQISNNIIQSNGGAYGGGIRIGTPHVAEPLKDHQNDDIKILNNRIIANGGTNLAGAIGLFAGAERYEIAYNDICGNFSAEYGGGISHYGFSPFGSIHHNRIYYNRSYDEGGGIIIAGELPDDPATLSPGSGPVNVYANLIQGNLSNDDGGGLRFLMSGNFPFAVYNNMIVNNVSTHEGGGISLNDAPNVRIYNNTIMKNITTATALTSNGLPAPAGVATARNSNLLQETLPANAPVFSDPLMFNNIFYDNRAGTWIDGGIAGIGQPGDPFPIFYWDLGTSDGSGTLSPVYSLLHQVYNISDPTNIYGADPLVVNMYDTLVQALPWRGNPNFFGVDIVSVELPPELSGDYHLTPDSVAIDNGVWWLRDWIFAPNQDIDGDPRPSWYGIEIGADEEKMRFPIGPILFSAPSTTINRANVSAENLQNIQTRIFLPYINAPNTSSWLNWSGQTDNFAVIPGEIELREDGYMYWNKTTFSADQEVYFTFRSVGSEGTDQRLLLKIDGVDENGLFGSSTRLISVRFRSGESKVFVETLTPEQGQVIHSEFGGISFKDGDVFGARTTRGGIVEIYQNGQLLGSVDLTDGENPWPFITEGGKIGVWFTVPDAAASTSVGFDKFGGGEIR